ncbi:MAG: hypothetical protein IJ438_10535 [Clostridia bacterium]|nr:hypothetical protein [Clostridia bacterium]
MLRDYFEPFALLERQSEPDGLGGESIRFAYVAPFAGALTQMADAQADIGGSLALRSEPVLLHDFEVTLRCGDYVRREHDGAIYRVCGQDARPPRVSALAFAQAPVERLVIPC